MAKFKDSWVSEANIVVSNTLADCSEIAVGDMTKGSIEVDATNASATLYAYNGSGDPSTATFLAASDEGGTAISVTFTGGAGIYELPDLSCFRYIKLLGSTGAQTDAQVFLRKV